MILALGLNLSGTVAAQAKADKDDIADADTNSAIVVTATRAPLPVGRTGRSLSVIDAVAIATSQLTGVTELLAQLPGVQFRRNGGSGAATSLYIRGADNAQSVVLYDGVRLDDPSTPGGGANLADVSTAAIDRIEVLRGAQSVLYGSQAIGGVVNITTLVPDAPFEARLQAEAGARESYLLRGGVGGRSAGFAWRADAGYAVTDGISASALGSEADGYENVSANARIDYQISPAVALDLRGYHAAGNVETDAFDGDSASRALTDSWLGYAGLRVRLFDRLDNRFAYSRTDIAREDRDESDPAAPVQTFDSSGTTDRFEYQGTLALGARAIAVFGADYAGNALRTSSFGAVPAMASDDTLGLYTLLVTEPAVGLTLTSGLRREHHSAFGGKSVGSAAIAYSPDGGGSVLRASYAEGFKAPSLFQLYADIYGNRDLTPEVAQSWEAGIDHSPARALTLSATYFRRTTENLVAFVPCSADPSRNPCLFGFYANEGRVKAEGLELSAEARLGRIVLAANYTRLDARYATPGSAERGNRLARRAGHTANLLASYRNGSGLSLSATLTLVGDSYNDAANTQLLAGYATADIRAAYPLGDRVEIYGRVENLFDAQYQTILDYNAQPRSAYAGLRLQL